MLQWRPKKKVQSVVICGKCADEFASPLTTSSFKGSGTIGWEATFWLNSVHTWIPCSLSILFTFRPQNFTSFVFVLYIITWRLESNVAIDCNIWSYHHCLAPLPTRNCCPKLHFVQYKKGFHERFKDDIGWGSYVRYSNNHLFGLNFFH